MAILEVFLKLPHQKIPYGVPFQYIFNKKHFVNHGLEQVIMI